MTRNQRLSFLGIAAVIAVVAVVILASRGGGEPAGSGTPAAATPAASGAPAARATSTATPRPQVPVLRRGQVRRLRFKEGETVRFRVRHDAPEEVHVHGYDISKDIEAGEPVEFAFRASITGIFEVELEHSGEQLAELRVDPS